MAEVSGLFDAIKSGDAQAVSESVAADSTLGHAQAESGETPLLLAKYYGRENVVQALLEAGVEPNLFESAALGLADRIGPLIARNPEWIDAFSPDGFTALQLAAYFGHPQIVEDLLVRGADFAPASRNAMRVTALHAAIASRPAEARHESVRLLIERGADVNVAQQGGFTALHAAAQNGDLELARILLAKGAEPSARTEKGQTPDSLAEEDGHAELALLLRDAMAAG